ncbi:hypothetical protein KFU94_27625 [Chloroflexi bacterium TSY]|nr:hypothetical protein [Chloroflexi bacterium TSY]
MASPHFAIGGNSPLWLYALVQEGPTLLRAFTDEAPKDFEPLSQEQKENPEEHEELILAFTGADIVTHMASLTTLDSHTGRDLSNVLTQQTNGVPTSLRWLFFPMSDSSTITHWQSLPFVLLFTNRKSQSAERLHTQSEYTQSRMRSSFAELNNRVSAQRGENDEHERVITTVAIGFVVALVICAMFM